MCRRRRPRSWSRRSGEGVASRLPALRGEQHGFRKAETIERAYEAELSFYGQVLGFEPADDIPVLPIEYLSEPVT